MNAVEIEEAVSRLTEQLFEMYTKMTAGTGNAAKTRIAKARA